MNISPLAADSLGVRSMATLVETQGIRVLIDPGVTIADTRYGLDPSPAETQAQEEASTRIIGALCQVDAVVVTHYHDDHANLLPYVLSSTAVFLKTPSTQAEHRFTQEMLPQLYHTNRRVAFVDNSSRGVGDVSLEFSPPLPHGKPGCRAGSVMAVAVRSKNGCFVHASDVQGPLSEDAVAWLMRQRPDILYLSGAPTFRLYYQAERDADALSVQDVRTARAHLLRLMKYTGCQVILDHYLVRDKNFRRLYQEVFSTGNVWTAAEFLGAPEQFLEARRRDQESREVPTYGLPRHGNGMVEANKGSLTPLASALRREDYVGAEIPQFSREAASDTSFQ